MTVRVRFAPSPTGALHIGGLRTALFNWLFARHEGGQFLLRIEDTDQVRSKVEYLDGILEALRWAGLTWDDDPVFQGRRFPLYTEHAERLLTAGLAERREGAVVFQMPRKPVAFEDLIRGTVTFDCSLLDDLVIMKSDGSPTYNFACVVDDGLMQITHVIRGEDHISNTPKQLVLYEALGFAAPTFAHIPLILAPDRSRLSKRHGATSVTEYRDLGYVPEAVVNYLSLLGWSPGDDRELLSLEETVSLFDLKRVNKTGAIFNVEKLDWMNGAYLRKMPLARIKALLAPLLAARGSAQGPAADAAWLERYLALYQERLTTLPALLNESGFFFVDEVARDPGTDQQHLARPGLQADFEALLPRLEVVTPFVEAEIERCVRGFVEERGMKAKDVIHPLRVAVTGRSVSPGLFAVLAVLGKERTLTRLRQVTRRLPLKTEISSPHGREGG